MGLIKVRNLPDEVVLSLDKMAKAANLSRESYLRKQLIVLVDGRDMEEEVKAIQADLFRQLLPTLERNNDVLEKLLSRF